MNLPSLPRTERTFKSEFWPSVIKYRAFTAGQQTQFLQVADPNTPAAERASTMEQIFDACVDAGAPFSKLPIGVVEEVFILMRSISIGEIMKIRYECNNKVGEPATECGKELALQIPLTKVVCTAKEGFKEVFDLPGGYYLKMRQPSFSDAVALAELDSVEATIATFIHSLADQDGQVWEIENPDETGLDPNVAKTRRADKEHLIKWVGENLETEIIKDISENFFQKIPRIHYKSEITCPGCGKKHPIEFNSVNEIFI